mgnify:CR=1 FL=1
MEVFTIRNLTFAYPEQEKHALSDLTLSVQPGEFLVLCGPSGCGKSTLLRIIAGLLKPDTGSVLFNGNDITNAPPEKRKAAMVFQNYALWPHMSVFENIAFGLQIQGKKKPEIRETVMQMLELVRMADCAGRRIQSLSGGQQQRLVIACAFAKKPDVIILDEPTSGLDGANLHRIAGALRQLSDEGKAVLVITHDLELVDMVCDSAIRLPLQKTNLSATFQ